MVPILTTGVHSGLLNREGYSRKEATPTAMWRYWWQQVRNGWHTLWWGDSPRESERSSSFQLSVPDAPRSAKAPLIPFPLWSADGQLPPRVYRQLIRQMQDHIRGPCPNCQTDRWVIWPKFGVIEFEGLESGDRIPVVLAICDTCGWTSSYVLNRVDPDLKAWWYGEEVPPDDAE